MNAFQVDVAILGADPAGLAAALALDNRGHVYSRLQEKKVCLILRGLPAGSRHGPRLLSQCLDPVHFACM